MRKRGIAVCLVVVGVLLGLSALQVPSVPAQGEVTDLPTSEPGAKGHPKLESPLDQIAAATRRGETSRQPRRQGLQTSDGRVRVVAEAAPGNVRKAAAIVQALGGKTETSFENLLQVLMPVPSLETLADDVNVRLVRLPFEPVTAATGQGVSLVNASHWQSTGLTGAGTKVGVLDGGFFGYESLLGTELPSSVQTFWASSIGGPGSSKHGTACAEIVYDIAPQAQFYLANSGTDVELANAVGWLVGQGVSVVSHSVGYFNAGPGDGSGPVGERVTYARNAGVLWSQAAGNSAREHWSGSWQDTNANNWHDFRVSPTRDEGQTIYAEAGEEMRAYLRWDDPWGASANDYDLYLKLSANGQTVASSTTRQNGNQYPRESIRYVTAQAGNYYVGIGRYSASGTSFFNLFVTSHDLEYQVASGSLLQPADSGDALTVGAVPWSNPGTLEAFSSQGPTADGRIKPDVVAPDGVASVAYGGNFFGTSAATPHVAGAALLVKQRFPLYTPAQIQSYLKANAVDLGAGGEDNLYGSGRLRLPDIANALSGTVKLEGGERPPAGFNVPLTLKLYAPSAVLTFDNILTEAPLFTFSTAAGNITITDTDPATRTSTFAVSGLPVGTYNITLSSPQSLINLRNGVAVSATVTMVDMGTLLEGDAKEDIQINIDDFTMLLNDYLQTPGGPKWNGGRSDFDRNGQVSAVDFTLLLANYNKTSPQTVQ